MPSGLDPWRGRTPLLHSLQISSPGEAGNCAEGKGSSWNAEPFPPHGLGHPPMYPHPPALGTPRRHRDEISFPGLIQLNVNESPFTLPRATLTMNVSPSSSFIYQTACSLADGVRGGL